MKRDRIIKIMTIAKGKAAIMDAVCRPCKPPDHNSTAAARDWMTPHTNFTGFGGFKSPFVVNVPSTNVAESAEVIKNVAIRMMAMVDMTAPIGN